MAIADTLSLMRLPINHDFGVDMNKAKADFLANSTKAKLRLKTMANVDKLLNVVKAAGFSPEFFMAYELMEQGSSLGWLNHTRPQGADTFADAQFVAKRFVERSKAKDPLNLAYYDASNPKYKTSATVVKAAQEDVRRTMPAGSIGRIYLQMTAAAFWAAYDRNALNKSVNLVQTYGDPFAGVIRKLNSWGAKGSTTASTYTAPSAAPKPTPTATQSAPSQATGARIPKSGRFVVKYQSLNVRNAPTTKVNNVAATYGKGQGTSFDSTVIAEGYLWASYISASRVRRYVALGVVTNGVCDYRFASVTNAVY